MSLTVWVGPMFAGKTTAMMREVEARRATRAAGSVFIVKHALDRRYGAAAAALTAHDGHAWKAHAVVRRLADADVGDATLIAVDEGQFFDDLAVVCDRWAHEGRDVLVATLISDYNRDPFAAPSALLSKADKIVFMEASCAQCGREASFTYYLGERQSKQTEFAVGGSESYVSLCRRCFRAPHNCVSPRRRPLPRAPIVTGRPEETLHGP